MVREARADGVSYAYDALGRVIEAIDLTTGQAVFYAYDSVGNITSQQVVALGTLAIAGFSADSGAPGTQVTIDGTGFSTTPNANTVTINGVAATVVSATQTQLVVTVPAGAATGTIAVQTGSSTASSRSPFSVTPGVVTGPTITGFSPGTGGAGTTVNISGSAFAPNATDNKVRFNDADAQITAATATALTVAVPNQVSSGPVEVITPYGAATSGTNFIVPPAGYS